MGVPTKISNLFSDIIGNDFDIEEILYDGSDFNVKLFDNKKRFHLTFSNITIFLDTSAFDIWMFWDRFKDEVERSCIFELPDSELRDYLLLAHPNPSATTQGAQVFCLLSKERVFLMLFRVKPEITISPIS